MTRFTRWVEETRGPRLRRLRGALALVGRRPRGLLGARSGSSSTCRPRRRPSACSRDRAMPGARWFPGARAQLRRARLPRTRADAASRSSRARSAASRTRSRWGELRDAGRRAPPRACARSASSAATASSPTCRTSPRRSSAFLATASLGAIWSSCSPDFGARTVVDRFAQIEPKVLLAVDGYRYGGRDFDRRDVVAELQREMPTLERTVVLPYLARGARPRAARRRADLGRAARATGDGAALEFERGAVRPPAVGPLLLGHDRPAEGDRARARRASCSST